MFPRLSNERGARPKTLAGQLVLTFAVVLTLFGVALLVVLQAMTRMESADREEARLDRSKHAVHRVAALLRDQYIHQAHTLIEWNRTHIAHYEDIASRTASAADALVTEVRDDDDRRRALEVSRLVRQSDRDFMNVTLRAIDGDEHVAARDLHVEMEKVVVTAARELAALSARFDAQSETARALAMHERSRVRWTALACFGAAMLLAGAFATVTTRALGRRALLLRNGAKRLGSGDLAQRLELKGHDELADVAEALNEMAERLAMHQAELVRSQKLASMGRLAAGVAHEINGPIGIILGYAKIIRTQGVDEEALTAIESEAKQCQRIVQTLLDTAKPEAARSDAVDLAQLARDAVERLRASGAAGGRRIRVNSHGRVVASGDESRLRQVVLNLLTNAVEATSDRGRIEVDVREEAGRAVCAIGDDGGGFPPQSREQLFEPFFTTKPNGTGLGLAISRAIVEAHRGELRVAAAPPRGARVEMHLESRHDEVRP